IRLRCSNRLLYIHCKLVANQPLTYRGKPEGELLEQAFGQFNRRFLTLSRARRAARLSPFVYHLFSPLGWDVRLRVSGNYGVKLSPITRSAHRGARTAIWIGLAP